MAKLISCILVFLCVFISSGNAWADNSIQRPPLTVELLQERIQNPIQQNGVTTIDLRQTVVNLTPENAEFREQFYQKLQSTLNRSKQPLGIDLSQAEIQGELVARRLGLQTPLVQEALAPLFSTPEQERILQDPRLQKLADSDQSTQPIPYATVLRGALILEETQFQSSANFENIFFLQFLEAANATFEQGSCWKNTRFGRNVNFSGVTFQGNTNFQESIFWGKANFEQASFKDAVDFSHTQFNELVQFEQAEFNQLATWLHSHFIRSANFNQSTWRDRVLFSKSRFLQTVSFKNATFEKTAAFREARFNGLVNIEGASILEKVDFSNAVFPPNAHLNIAHLAFDSEAAKLLGETGIIGQVISVPELEGNENVLKSLVLNFRSLEQIPDANQIEYKIERLRLQQLGTRLVATPLRHLLEFSNGWDALHWIGLSLLLLLSDYGTNFSLVFNIGIVAVAYFGVLFWFIDRWRRRIPKPILPTLYETVWILSSYFFLSGIGITGIFQSAHQPWLTLACLVAVLLPLPLFLMTRLYLQGRYHDLLTTTYFVEDAGMRQLRLLIVRLPIMPRFEFFRNRYMPILWDRRWNWLNYYDFSLNNLLKVGFNDIRLRDEHMPGIITTLAWYQWGLGILYIALLLWTLSRTIPGLNLLIYLK